MKKLTTAVTRSAAGRMTSSISQTAPCRTQWGKAGTRYSVTVTYHERPDEPVEIRSKRPDGLWTLTGANRRVNREWREAITRGLSVQTSTVRLVRGL